MLTIFLTIFLTGFFFLAFFFPRHAALFILATLPLYLVRFSFFGIPSTLLEGMILLLFLVLFFTHRRKIHFSPLRFRILLLFVASVIALFVTPDLRSGLGVWKAYILDPLLFFFSLLALFEKKDVRMLVNALGVSAFAVSAYALFQYFTGFGIPEPWHPWESRRVTSLYPFPNAVGLFLAPISALFIGKYFFDKHSSRLWSLTIVLLTTLSIVFSRSDGAIVALFIVILLSLWFHGKKKIASAIFAVAFILALVIPQIREVVTFQDVSGQVRLALWQGTWNMLSHRPLVGAGLAGFPIVYDIYRLARHTELLQYPHNIFLNFWSELGILGLAWIFSILPVMFRDFSRRKGLSMAIFLAFVALFIHGLVDVPYFKNDLSVLFWALLAFSLLEQE